MGATSIPAFHVSTKSAVKGSGTVFIASRADAISTGKFSINIDPTIQFDPAVNAYPIGALSIKSDMSDSTDGKYISTSIELINSYGKHNPTVYLTGQCKLEPANPNLQGLRYWVMIVHNKNAQAVQTADVVGFCIHDRNGNRVAYGTGPLESGDVVVAPQ